MSRRSWLAAAVVALLVVGGGGAAVIAQSGSEDLQRIVVLARADNPVDALAASTVAAQLGGRVLLTYPDSLGESARAGIEAADPDLVILAGGEAALSAQVDSDVKGMGYATRRVAGPSRTETAKELAALLDEFRPAFAHRADPVTRAQALVWGGADPAFDPDRSVGFLTVASPTPGIYCLGLDASLQIDVEAAVVLTTIDWGDSIGSDLVAHWVATNPPTCATGEIEIQTYHVDGGATTLTPDASFAVVVP